MQTGTDAFLEGLRVLGFSPTSVAEKPDHVIIDYQVESGKLAGMKLRLGFIVPPDFPVTPPSGIHVAALIHPFKGDGQHPTGAIHRDHALPFETVLGGSWQYWSRPPANWATGRKTVAAYMSHVWCLWDSQ